MVVVRYAPSPTGLQHIGGLRTALYNYLFARSTQGRFILRIEDTDRKRYSLDALDDIYTSLRWLGIEWDEGPDCGGKHEPYMQSQRINIYRKHVQTLISKGNAYESKEKTEDGKTSQVVRLVIPDSGSVDIEDVLLGPISFQCRNLPKDPVLIKSDGYPTYHFANVVDDHEMEVSHVLRSQEWISSVGIHVLIYKAMGWKTPFFCHLPFVCSLDGKKLSKRHDAVSVGDFRKAGYLPDALRNYLVLLGWSYDDKRELFSAEDLKKLFSLEGLNKSPAVFDRDRLNWFNRYYIRNMDNDALLASLQNCMQDSREWTEQDWVVVQKLLPLLRERITTLCDAPLLMRFIFSSQDQLHNASDYLSQTDAETALRILRGVHTIVGTAPDLEDEANLEQELRNWAAQENIQVKKMFMTMRLAISWSKVSLPLLQVIPLIGREKVLQRIDYAYSTIEKEST